MVGNVGIGTLEPQSALHVNGDISLLKDDGTFGSISGSIDGNCVSALN